MDSNPVEGGSQLVLDNRKIILAFAILMLICGTFFVIGFMEGKRQGVQRTTEKSSETGTAVAKPDLQQTVARLETGTSETPGDKGVRDRLDWYNSVNKRADETVKGLEPARASNAAVPAGGAAPGRVPQGTKPGSTLPESKAKPAPSTKVIYSVQVGAFRHRAEAETKAEQLRSRKYSYVIEPSGDADQLFLIKVGKYESRADAVAMQNRLRKDGFSTFIKTSK